MKERWDEIYIYIYIYIFNKGMLTNKFIHMYLPIVVACDAVIRERLTI